MEIVSIENNGMITTGQGSFVNIDYACQGFGNGVATFIGIVGLAVALPVLGVLLFRLANSMKKMIADKALYLTRWKQERADAFIWDYHEDELLRKKKELRI
ncbi:hypothetical protein LXL04_033820 [Taraxacum kok-saghyz]